MSCQFPSVFLADNEQVVHRFIHRLQVLHIEKLYQKCQTFVFMQIAERSLSCHGEASSKCLDAGCEIRNLVLAHIFNVFLFLSAKVHTFSDSTNKMMKKRRDSRVRVSSSLVYMLHKREGLWFSGDDGHTIHQAVVFFQRTRPRYSLFVPFFVYLRKKLRTSDC